MPEEDVGVCHHAHNGVLRLGTGVKRQTMGQYHVANLPSYFCDLPGLPEYATPDAKIVQVHPVGSKYYFG